MPSSAWALVALLALLAAAVLPLGAQAKDTAKAKAAAEADTSLDDRLARAEDAIDVMRRQLADMAATGVHTKPKVHAELFGRLLLTGFYNSGRVNIVDDPQFVLAGTASHEGSVGFTVRQSTVGAAMTVNDVLGGNVAGEITLDLFGAAPADPGKTFPQPRIRTVSVIMAWKNVDLLFGQESPLFLGVNPVSVAAVGVPEYVTAGNIWLWLPQIRVGVHTAGRFQFGVQGAALEPASGEPVVASDPDPSDIGERSGRPYLQGRAYLKWGADEMASEIGFDAHQGWFAGGGDSLISSWGVGADVKVSLASWLEIRGEVYRGRMLRGLGGGGVAQNFGVFSSPPAPADTLPPLNDEGAWAQIIFHARQVLEIPIGCGADQPSADQNPVRRRNVICSGGLIIRPGAGTVFALTYRRLETTYKTGKFQDDYINLSAGFEF
jgi:hypothetical protein